VRILLPSGGTANVSKDVKVETLQALYEMLRLAAKQVMKMKEIETYQIQCNACKELINFTSHNHFPINLTCPNCGRGLTIEKLEASTFDVTREAEKRPTRKAWKRSKSTS